MTRRDSQPPDTSVSTGTWRPGGSAGHRPLLGGRVSQVAARIAIGGIEEICHRDAFNQWLTSVVAPHHAAADEGSRRLNSVEGTTGIATRSSCSPGRSGQGFCRRTIAPAMIGTIDELEDASANRTGEAGRRQRSRPQTRMVTIPATCTRHAGVNVTATIAPRGYFADTRRRVQARERVRRGFHRQQSWLMHCRHR